MLGNFECRDSKTGRRNIMIKCILTTSRAWADFFVMMVLNIIFNPKHGRPLWKGVWWKVCKLHNSRGHFSKDRMSRLLTYCPRLLLSTDQLIKSYLSFRLGVLSQMTFRLHFSMSWGPGAIASVFVDLSPQSKKSVSLLEQWSSDIAARNDAAFQTT